MAALGLLFVGAALVEGSAADSRQPAAGDGEGREIAAVLTATSTATATPTPTRTSTPVPTATTRPKPKSTATREPSPTPNPDASFDPEELAFTLLYGYEGEFIVRASGVPDGAVDAIRIPYDAGDLRINIFATDTEAREWMVAHRTGQEFAMEYWGYPTAVVTENEGTDFYVAVGNTVVVATTSYELLIEAGYPEEDAKDYEQVAAWMADYGVYRVVEAGGFAPDESNAQTAHSWTEWAVS